MTVVAAVAELHTAQGPKTLSSTFTQYSSPQQQPTVQRT